MSSAMWNAISSPPSSSKPALAPTPFPAEQAAKIADLVAFYSDDGYKVGGASDGKLMEDEKMFLSQEGIARFLTATKWDERAAKARLDKCLTWRRSMNIYDLVKTNEEVAPESPAGKEYVIGYTAKSQPILHFLPNRSTTETSDRQFKHAIYMIERTCDLFPPGVQNLLLLIDFSGKRAAPTSPAMAQKFISSLQNHYPERLGKGVLLNIPWIVKQFIDGVSYFMDPVTKQKVATNIKIVDSGVGTREGTTRDYGGQIEFTYKHEEYWPMLLKICLERREQYRRNWRKLGGGVGLSEWEFKQAQVDKEEVKEVNAEPVAIPTKTDRPDDASGSLAVPRMSTATDRSLGTASFHSAVEELPTPPIDSATPPQPGSDERTPSPSEPSRSSPTGSSSVSDTRSRSESTATTLHEDHGLSELHIGGGDGHTVKPKVETIREVPIGLAPVALAAPI